MIGVLSLARSASDVRAVATFTSLTAEPFLRATRWGMVRGL
jgi:hypothetical protein